MADNFPLIVPGAAAESEAFAETPSEPIQRDVRPGKPMARNEFLIEKIIAAIKVSGALSEERKRSALMESGT